MENKITDSIIERLYDYSVKVYNGLITNQAALNNLEPFIKKNSATDYLCSYKCMIEGKIFFRTINCEATDYYLNRIYKDQGEAILRKALISLSAHIKYYKIISKTNVISQQEILNKYTNLLDNEPLDIYQESRIYPSYPLTEGERKTILVNIYERNPHARAECIRIYGCQCTVCKFDFTERYGGIGKNFIHVHHKKEISSIGKKYSIDPNDLVPVCPNCHAMLHKRNPAYSIEELRDIILEQTKHVSIP